MSPVQNFEQHSRHLVDPDLRKPSLSPSLSIVFSSELTCSRKIDFNYACVVSICFSFLCCLVFVCLFVCVGGENRDSGEAADGDGG